MKCLLVISHPCADSLNAMLAEVAAVALRGAGHEVRIRNLYEQGFQPALSAGELKSFRIQPAQPDAAAEAEELLAAEVLVIVFPTWWFGMPAMLKGWFDRVWAPGIAYDPAETGALLPRLHGLRRTIAVTTLGAPWWVDWLVMRRPVRKNLKRAILGVCAPNAKLEFLSFYGCGKPMDARIASMKERVSLAMGRV